MDPVVNPRDPQAAPALASPAAAAPAAAPPVAGAGPLVQLGALESEASAQRHWAALAARVEGLGQHTPSIERFETGGRTVWRLRIRGLSTIAEANALCAQVRAAGGPCFATR
jgi:cell division septation protein DedD